MMLRFAERARTPLHAALEPSDTIPSAILEAVHSQSVVHLEMRERC